jgi:hypothetical protein
MTDVFEAIAKHADMVSATRVSQLNCEIHSIVFRHVKQRKDALVPYFPVILLLRNHFGPAKRNDLEKSGLRQAFLHFVTSRVVTVGELLTLESLLRERVCDALHLSIGDYTTANDNTIHLTVESLLREFDHRHKPVRCFCKGKAHATTFYYEHQGQIYLPRCSDGDFYSWGFAMRVGGVGSFESAPQLLSL